MDTFLIFVLKYLKIGDYFFVFAVKEIIEFLLGVEYLFNVVCFEI